MSRGNQSTCLIICVSVKYISIKHLRLTVKRMADLPSPPFVDIPGIANFRDAGDGKKLRRGLLFRSADASKETEEGKKKMSQDLGMVCLPIR